MIKAESLGFGMRLGDGGSGVDDKSGISCGFGILFSLQISNLIFDSSLQNFRPEFIHHSCLRALGCGNFRFAQFLSHWNFVGGRIRLVFLWS